MNLRQRSLIFTFASLLLLIGIVSLFGYEVRLVFRVPLIIFSGVILFYIYRRYTRISGAVGDWKWHRELHGVRYSASAELLRNADQQADAMLSDDEPWDEENGVKPGSDTWTKARSLLETVLAKLSGEEISSLLYPRISSCADGSIDIYWDMPTFTLLVNVKAEKSQLSLFYGVKTNGQDFDDIFVNIAPLKNEIKW